MCDCYWDNPAIFYECRTVKGRKEYRCCECLNDIAKGERHECAKGLWEDGGFDSFRTCSLCCSMRDEINLTSYCHAQMMECLDERDYPGVDSVASFLARRRENWNRLYRKEPEVVS